MAGSDVVVEDEPVGTFAKRLRRLMDERGLTQYSLTKRLGYDSDATVWRLVHAKSEPGYMLMRRLKKALDCEYKDLFED